MKTSLTLTLLILAGSATAAPAGDAAAGRAKAKACAACHGLDGKGRIHLAGKNADYLAAQLHAFKRGQRKSPMMNTLAGKLSDEDIADLAAYFAAQ
ncbi:MAG TPA: c-type cytochrome [Gammaproteobacteria bacterium]|nr:c-type cytochrome [Gammaproteobacteria bacterium]